MLPRHQGMYPYAKVKVNFVSLIVECSISDFSQPTPVVAFRPVSRRCKGRNSLSEWLAPFHGSKSDRISMSMWPAFKETPLRIGRREYHSAGTHQT
ncbi:hypothetical protein ASPTUDRAFT_518239 [Aspergillus tubingensis CBS 134.48]|uniref:Uncharacterized protein n=1 Tax=Aspergillus tubingensis (strain CBS 134.48) TaxID=767770 RepID=A0A1L9NCZ0_ASPTC|nr:hypothetical protein ASPTUDRAFT_518239 [Aspergillus tubingensis CBS 134.48]